MGAYTHTASFVFNGYTHVPEKVHCISQTTFDKDASAESEGLIFDDKATLMCWRQIGPKFNLLIT